MYIIIYLLIVHFKLFASSYIGVPGPLTWTESEAFCENTFGTNLASIHSSTTNTEDVVEICQAITPYSSSIEAHCWMGLNDIDSEGTFEWTDASTVDYTQTITNDVDEDCVGVVAEDVSPYSAGDWINTDCSDVTDESSFLCNNIENN
eukprot:170695_1